MTVRRDPGSVAALVLATLAKLSDDELRAAGITRRQMRRWADADGVSRIPLEDAAALDQVLAAKRQRPVFLAWYAQRMGALKQPGEARDLGTVALRLSAETGDVARAVAHASADGVVTVAEAREIAAEAQEVADWALEARDRALAIANAPQQKLRVAK